MRRTAIAVACLLGQVLLGSVEAQGGDEAWCERKSQASVAPGSPDERVRMTAGIDARRRGRAPKVQACYGARVDLDGAREDRAGVLSAWVDRTNGVVGLACVPQPGRRAPTCLYNVPVPRSEPAEEVEEDADVPRRRDAPPPAPEPSPSDAGPSVPGIPDVVPAPTPPPVCVAPAASPLC